MQRPACRVIPVIHHIAPNLSLEQAKLAFELGADGVFLISHHGDDASLIPLVNQIRQERPTAWLGINFLSKGLPDAFALAIDSDVRIDGIWSDKYQAFEPDPGLAAAKALELSFTPTTSGAATGSAPSLAKIEGIRRAIGPDAPLACASGMTLDNIAVFAPLLSHVLVATGVSRDEHHFDARRLETFIHLARSACASLATAS